MFMSERSLHLRPESGINFNSHRILVLDFPTVPCGAIWYKTVKKKVDNPAAPHRTVTKDALFYGISFCEDRTMRRLYIYFCNGTVRLWLSLRRPFFLSFCLAKKTNKRLFYVRRHLKKMFPAHFGSKKLNLPKQIPPVDTRHTFCGFLRLRNNSFFGLVSSKSRKSARLRGNGFLLYIGQPASEIRHTTPNFFSKVQFVRNNKY